MSTRATPSSRGSGRGRTRTTTAARSPRKLHTLAEPGLEPIDLSYKESKRTDEYGNQFRYRAKVDDARRAHGGRLAWDVFLARVQ